MEELRIMAERIHHIIYDMTSDEIPTIGDIMETLMTERGRACTLETLMDLAYNGDMVAKAMSYQLIHKMEGGMK